MSLSIEDGDLNILKEGTVDFTSFSYYMSVCVRQSGEENSIGGNLTNGKKNPY